MVEKRNITCSEEERNDLNRHSARGSDDTAATNSSARNEEKIEELEEEHFPAIVRAQTLVSRSWRRFKAFVYASRNWIGSILARLAFLFIAVLSVALTVASMVGDNVTTSYCLLIPLLLIIVEAVITLIFRSNKEWKWATPCIFTLLLSTIPSMWLIELQYFQLREERRNNITTAWCKSSFEARMIPNINLGSREDLVNLMNTAQQFCLCQDCTQMMGQLLLVVLIVGRWLLPKAKSLTSDQKAQLLLTNIAVGSDIIEVYELVRAKEVTENFSLMVVVLIIWSFSLLQFVLVITATAEKRNSCCSIFESEIWALVTLLCLQDFAFVLLRLVCVIRFKAISYSTYFFLVKNLLIMMLDINRIATLSWELHNERGSFPAKKTFRLTHIRR